jgi:glycosyltransferase involved in cell wall biosynthesis
VASVAVVTSSPPSVEGGHLVIARSLVAALHDCGHTASLITTPECNFGHQVPAYVDTWNTDLRAMVGHPVDQVISLRFPSYAVRHDRHVCWLNHTMREYYDLWPQFSASISPRARVKERLKRRVAHGVDRWLLTHNVHKRLTISHTVENRLRTYLGIGAEALWPPAPQRAYRCDRYGDYVLAISRLTPLKRLDLLIRALAHPAASGIRAVIAGDGESRRDLEALARHLGVDDRVALIGHAGDEVILEHLAVCRAVCFTPYDEDYGFVTVEAFASGKAVVTCTDSGGPTELVRNGETGLVADPTASSLALALARVAGDAAFAEELGRRANQQACAMTWRAAVERLIIV